MDNVTGTIESVIYVRESTGYAVLGLKAPDGSNLTLVGCVPGPVPGETLEARGRWVRHPSFGRQFEVAQGDCDRTLPADRSALFAYLRSGSLPGVGMATAKAMLDKFGTDILDVIECSPERLTEIKGISAKRAAAIRRAFVEQTGVRRLAAFLASHRLPPHHALTLFRLYGADAMAALTGDPYLLARQPFSADFSEVDRMALSMGVTAEQPVRLRAAVLFELTYNLDQGHCYIPYRKLAEVSGKLLGLDDMSLEDAVDGLVRDGEVVREDINGSDACYLTELYMAERGVAERAMQMAAYPPGAPKTLDSLLERVERGLGLKLADEQRRAVTVAASSRLFLLTGGPGTGKTTTLRAIVDLYRLMGLKVALAAPTGRAAKRLGEVCMSESATIHRLLGVAPNPDTGALGFAFGPEQPLDFDAVVVDETSMVDIRLMDSLMSALKADTRLILSGDRDQLPAVGPGTVLADLLDCGNIDSVALTSIFRQAAESRIVVCAHTVNRGEMPEITNKGDLFWMPRSSAGQTLETLVDLCVRRLPENMGLPPSSIQVLTPTRRGECGTRSLNEALQQAINPADPSKREHRYGDVLFREGDRVMQIKNNYDLSWKLDDTEGLGVFNGDVGRILTIDIQTERLTVRFDDLRTADYTFEQLGELEPAYAMTVHKAQGSEYPAVVLALTPCAPGLISRRVLYTAMTRARELLVMVGDRGTLEAMVRSGKDISRYGALRTRLL